MMTKEAKSAVDVLRKFLDRPSGIEDRVVDHQKYDSLKQSEITEFISKYIDGLDV